jgi:ribosomal protein L12E/L44/L45/RPP1/RPP2
MERESKGSRGLGAYCKGGQGPPWAVAPSKKKKKKKEKEKEKKKKKEKEKKKKKKKKHGIC